MIEQRERVMMSQYMQWAKTHLQARFNLASSGLGNYPLAEFPVKIEDLELSGPSYYGYGPLQEALAAKCGVPANGVVAATGASMANHLVMAALIGPGDEVLIERPTYELLVSTAQYLGAEVKRFSRPFESDYQINLEEVARMVSRRTRLIVVTNLHNPTSTLTDDETLKELGGDCAQSGRAHSGRRSLSRSPLRPCAALGLSPRRGVHDDQQPDESLWIERAALRLDSGETGNGRKALASQRPVRRHSGARGGAFELDRPRKFRCYPPHTRADCLKQTACY